MTILTTHSDFYTPFRRELAALGAPVVDIDWGWKSKEAVGGAQIEACVVWFYDCLRKPMQVWRLKQQLGRLNIPLVAWNRDAPHYLNRKPWRLDLLDRFHLLDIYASHTLIDDRRFADAHLYLPNAADTARYNVETFDILTGMRASQGYAWDVGFFGGMDGLRYKEDKARAEFFAALGEELTRRNVSYRFQEAEGMSLQAQIEFIRQSRINLNFGARCEYQAPIASGLPERCYGIPAAGGFLLCDKRTHAHDDFTVGVNWAEFDGLDDCLDRIVYWLAHFDAARDLAERCHAHVMTHHTYAQRADTVLAALSAWRDGRRGRLG